MIKLTTRQKEILQLIESFNEETGRPPTRIDICTAMGFKSPNAAECHLRALERKGAIEMQPGSSRGIRLPHFDGIPLVGRVAAGAPILAQENIEKHFKIDPRMFSPKADYLLKVKGESMRDAGILDGDFVAVHQTPHFANGQIVIARIGEEVTVKRIQKKLKMIELLPANPDFEPIVINPLLTEFAIEGLAVGVIRNGAL